MPRARVFYDVLATVDDNLAFAIALELVDGAPEWTTTQLRDRLRRAVLKADPNGAADRASRSVAARRMQITAERDGTAALFGTSLPAARAVAAFERVDAIARARRSGDDERDLDQLRADTFLDLLEGVPVDTAPIHRRGVIEIVIPWSTVAGADEPATLAGFGPLDATTSRSLLDGFVERDDFQWRYSIVSAGGNGNGGDRHGYLLRHGLLPTPGTVGDIARLLPRVTGPPTPQPPVETDPHRRAPGSALTRWIQARDRICRAPGCRVPARACDIDHAVDHATGGPTTDGNLALLCRHHHRLKHEGGWRLTQPTPGVLHWCSPHGQVHQRV